MNFAAPITAGLALLAGGAAVAFLATGIASAETETERQFITSVASQGYNQGRALDAGYRVCSLLDNGMSQQGVERFVVDTFNDHREHSGYYATLFAQYATYNLCPRNLHRYGPV